jgi:hypothetical protein
MIVGWYFQNRRFSVNLCLQLYYLSTKSEDVTQKPKCTIKSCVMSPISCCISRPAAIIF